MSANGIKASTLVAGGKCRTVKDNGEQLHCCISDYVFEPEILYCYSNKGCFIAKGMEYWYLQGGLTFCRNCYSNESGQTLTVNEAFSKHGRSFTIRKQQLLKKKNIGTVSEPIITCDDCGKKYHEICVLYSKKVYPGKYICDACFKNKGVTRQLKQYTAKGLQETCLSSYMERRVNAFLKLNRSKKNIVIRVIANVEKKVKVKPAMQSRYDWPEEIPYRAKTICGFQNFDGADVCFFSMCVQEYNENVCPRQNAKRVYISHIETVPFCVYFEPVVEKDALYQEIIFSYLAYMKKQDYLTVHIWACPPHPCDYAFRGHFPFLSETTGVTQITEKLLDWFKELFKEGVQKSIIGSYKNISISNIESISQVPYFDNDFLPLLFDQSIEQLELDADELERKFKVEASLNVTDAGIINEDFQSINRWEKVDYKTKDNDKSDFVAFTELDLIEKVYPGFQNFGKMCYVVNLQTDTMKTSYEEIVPRNPDPLISWDNMVNRNVLHMFGNKHLEFSTLRRAKYSTLMMLHYLHVQCQIPVCSQCKKQIETRYICIVCDNYKLCSRCFNSTLHDHPMERHGLGLDEHDCSENLEELLVHTFSCQDDKCKFQWCKAKKKLLDHLQTCKNDPEKICSTCFEFNCLCTRHSFACQNTECKVPRCLENQHKLSIQRVEIMKLEKEALERKISIMQNCKLPEESQQDVQPSNEVPSSSQNQVQESDYCSIS